MDSGREDGHIFVLLWFDKFMSWSLISLKFWVCLRSLASLHVRIFKSHDEDKFLLDNSRFY